MKEYEIESLLVGLTPRGPSTDLVRRVEHELELDRQWMHDAPESRVPRQTRWQISALWAGIGAVAAAIVISVWMPALSTSSSAPSLASAEAPTASSVPPAVLPVATIREVVGTHNEGIHYNATSRLPEQHLRVMSVERHAWIDPRDGAQITLERPREDSVVLPVSFQ